METINVKFEGCCYYFPIINVLKKYYKINICDKPDFLFYGWINNEHMYYPPHCIRIYSAGEVAVPNFNYCDYAIGTAKMDFGERYFRYPYCFSFVNTASLSNRSINKDKALSRKFCNFVYTNRGNSPAIVAREDFCKLLQQYKHVDCPGASLNNMKNAIGPRFEGDWAKSKLDFIKDYKFTIAFENFFDSGYISEKLTHPFLVNSIPIYKGAPDVFDEFNRNAIIDASYIDRWDAVIERIIYLDTHDDEYIKVLNNPVFNESFNIFKFHADFEKFILNIIEKRKTYQHSIFIHFDPTSRITRDTINTIKGEILVPLMDDNIDAADSLIHDFEGAKFRQSWLIPDHINKLFLPLRKKASFAIYFEKSLIFYKRTFPEEQLDEHRIDLLFSVARWAASSKDNPSRIKWITDQETTQSYRQLLAMLRPHDLENNSRAPLGGFSDGRCVVPDNHGASIAWSFGVHTKPPARERDLELARQGLRVFQFDGFIGKSPSPHENTTFFSKTVVADSPHEENEITPQEILSLLRQENERNLSLFLDLEGGEWELFANMPEDLLSRFNVIHAEFHNLCDIEKLPQHVKIFEKILATHVCYHIHYNNFGRILAFRDFLVSDVMEITFARKDLGNFKPCDLSFPTELDAPNNANFPQIYIGRFSSFLDEDDQSAGKISAYDCKLSIFREISPQLEQIYQLRPDLSILFSTHGANQERVFWWYVKNGRHELQLPEETTRQLGNFLKRLNSMPYAEDAYPGYTMLVHSLWLTRDDLHSIMPKTAYGQMGILQWFKDAAINEYSLKEWLE